MPPRVRVPQPRPAALPADLAPSLLAWYDRARRDLPWRTAPDPYRTWLSEVMLQQTRVEVVVGYYARFLARFPTLEALAEAPLDDVLALWSGLGYYRRARMLHAGARAVVAEHGGRLPSTRATLLEVPGIGPYTAGAILSIAYGRPEPLVDGNVERVLTRVMALPGDPRKGPLKAALWALAAASVPADRPGDFNQALMELGATVCTPRAPRCDACPLASCCKARAEGTPSRYPELAPRAKARPVRLAAALVEDSRGRLLLLKRPDDGGLMAGLWELPTVELEPDVPAGPALEAALAGQGLGGTSLHGEPFATVRHSIMDRRITLEGHRGKAPEPRRPPRRRAPPAPRHAWVAPGALARHALSSMYSKLLAAAGLQRP